ncbi:MAG: GNAT family protein [Candidatus Nanopelagicales bacterium]
MSITRPLAIDDVAELTALLVAQREFMAPWEPLRDDAYFTHDVQRRLVTESLVAQVDGRALEHVILDGDAIVGRIRLAGIVRGAFQSTPMGYWVAREHNGRGLATAAVAEMLGIAFDELGLHRVQAETLEHNVASQRVLARNGFEPIGLAPAYLQIAGRWQDHVLWQRLADDR